MFEYPTAARAQLAQAIGLNEQYLYQVLTGRRKAPPERCPALEMASAGKLTCEQLRPDLAWHRISDESWPWHQSGRPLLDVARSAT